MSASSSRIMIAPVDDSRPLSDRFIDRLLGWWDTGGGRSMRRALRGAVAASGTRIRSLTAPVMERPLVAKSVAKTAAGLAVIRRWLGKAFAHDVPAPTPRPDTQRATIATATVATKTENTPPRSITVTKTATAEIRTPLRSATAEIRTPTRTGTAELRPHIRSGTGEIRPRTAPAITPVSSTQPQPTAMTTNLRCWSCLQRNRVRAPRRGGCFLCTACNATMLVVDPIVGLTCDIGQAESKGIGLNRQADETDPG